ncbi:MAG: hypothetical protein V1850_01170 [Candidatus Bathyarchaeota archaeon]
MTDDDIEIEYRPVKKAVILNLEKLDGEELFKRVSAIRMAEQPIFLNWADGVVFVAIPASPDITEVDENITKGVVYFSSVIYSLMAKCQTSVQVGADKIPIIDQSRSSIYRSITKWITKREKC